MDDNGGSEERSDVVDHPSTRRRRRPPPSPPVYTEKEAQDKLIDLCTSIFRGANYKHNSAWKKEHQEKIAGDAVHPGAIITKAAAASTTASVSSDIERRRTSDDDGGSSKMKRTQQKGWVHWYKHPLDGLRGMVTKQDLRAINYLPPAARIHNAVAKNNAYMVEELAIAGNPVNTRNESGLTPLHLACYFDFYECAHVLLDCGADKDALTDVGVTPLWVATRCHAMHCAAILRQAGAALHVPTHVRPGVRTCLDDDDDKKKKLPPIATTTAASAQAKNLGRRTYKRDF